MRIQNAFAMLRVMPNGCSLVRIGRAGIVARARTPSWVVIAKGRIR